MYPFKNKKAISGRAKTHIGILQIAPPREIFLLFSKNKEVTS